jgi:hypothetical protein
MNKFRLLSVALLATVSASASAQVALYGNTAPTGNYAAFQSALGALTTLTFNDQSIGLLNPNAYAGVTLTASANNNQLQFGTGPNDGNTGSPPFSTGEGAHGASNFLGGNSSSTVSLLIDFANPVFGAGLFVIDYFNPSSCNCSGPLLFTAYDGAGGTGSVIGSLTGIQWNMQGNHMYFVGITSGAGDIRSVLYSYNGFQSGDRTGIDDITYSGDGETVTPEPAALALLVPGLLAVGGVARRRKAKS